MQPTDDGAYLQQYAEEHSDEAFSALVRRHINLVYSLAMRQVGDPHQAEEITQAVFVILAKKSLQLRHERALSSWLFQATRLTAQNFARAEARRHRREQEVYMQSALNEAKEDVWPQIAPLLDAAVASLGENDRRAIVLRFYEGRTMGEVGAAMGASEEAAKKRVARAVERLQKYFSKRGVVSTAVVIGQTVLANSVQAAPMALTDTAVAVALGQGASASASTLTLIQGALKLMALTKAQTGIVAAVIVLIVAGAMVVVTERNLTARSAAPANAPATAPASTDVTAPVAEPALSAWERGDKQSAISNFLAADWSARPLFAAGSILSLSESDYVALSDSARQNTSAEMMGRLNSLKQMAAAVSQGGRDAAAKGDTAEARKYFTSLKDCGTALAGPQSLSLVQIVGRAFEKMGDSDLAGVGP